MMNTWALFKFYHFSNGRKSGRRSEKKWLKTMISLFLQHPIPFLKKCMLELGLHMVASCLLHVIMGRPVLLYCPLQQWSVFVCDMSSVVYCKLSSLVSFCAIGLEMVHLYFSKNGRKATTNRWEAIVNGEDVKWHFLVNVINYRCCYLFHHQSLPILFVWIFLPKTLSLNVVFLTFILLEFYSYW